MNARQRLRSCTLEMGSEHLDERTTSFGRPFTRTYRAWRAEEGIAHISALSAGTPTTDLTFDLTDVTARGIVHGSLQDERFV